MNKRVTAALLTLLLTGGLSGPAALADSLPEAALGGGSFEQPITVETTPEPELSALPEDGEDLADGTPVEPAPPVQETPPAQETPEPAPEQPGDEQPPKETPAPEQPPEDDGCNTIEELAELAARDEGGTISVTGDLVLPENQEIRLEAGRPVVIDLSTYGVTVPQGSSLILNGPIMLTGAGSPQPVLSVSGFLSTENGVSIRASGENAVSVRLTGGGWNSDRTSVEAVGPNACAVEAEGVERLDLYQLQLTARGGNAACVRSAAPVRLILCRAESEGLLASAPSLILDGTAASPEPGDAQIIRRVAGPGSALSENGVCIPTGASEEELAELLRQKLGDSTTYSLYDSAAEHPPILYWTPAVWTGGQIDLSRPGAYQFTGVPEERVVGAVSLPDRVVPVYVVDPAKPWLQDAERMGGSVFLRFFREIAGAESVTLWYSMDGGASWQDAAQLPGASVTNSGATLESLPLFNHNYFFWLEVRGGPMAGRSNRLPFAYYNDRNWNGGGDWDGGDWGDQGPLPDDNPAPPPEWEPDGGPAPAPEPEPDHIQREPDRKEIGGSQSGQGLERPARPAPPVVPAPPPMPAPPEIEAAGPAPIPTPIPAPTPAPDETTAMPAPSMPPAGETASAPASVPVSRKPEPGEEAAPVLPEGATAFLIGRDLETQKIANPGGVTLAENGLKVVLPHTLTDALNLGPEEVLAVRLAMSGPASFEVRFWADGREVEDFGGGAFTVTVPVERIEGTAYACAAPDGTETAASALTENRAEFALTAAGVYTLSTADGAAAPSASPQPTTPVEAAAMVERDERPAPILPLALSAGALAAVGGALLLLRGRAGDDREK